MTSCSCEEMQQSDMAVYFLFPPPASGAVAVDLVLAEVGRHQKCGSGKMQHLELYKSTWPLDVPEEEFTYPIIIVIVIIIGGGGGRNQEVIFLVEVARHL